MSDLRTVRFKHLGNDVVIRPHAVQRWCERVYPKLSRAEGIRLLEAKLSTANYVRDRPNWLRRPSGPNRLKHDILTDGYLVLRASGRTIAFPLVLGRDYGLVAPTCLVAGYDREAV